MKTRKTYLSLIPLLLIFLVLFSCKKEEISISENVFETEIIGNTQVKNLTMKDNGLRIQGQLIPDMFGHSVTVHISSKADPQGFEFEAELSDKQVRDGRTIYISKELNTSVYIADSTNAGLRRIKANKQDDELFVNIESGLYENSFTIDGRKILVYDFSRIPSVSIYDLGYSGNEREAVHIATQRVPNPRLVKLSLRSGQGFDYYYKTMTFYNSDISFTNGDAYYIGMPVDENGLFYGKITLLYYDTELQTEYGETGFLFLE